MPPSFADDLLGSDIADLVDSSYWASSYTVAFGTDVPGMQAMTDAIIESNPDAPASDFYAYGWTEAMITEAILRQAAENGDMTREGVVEAAFQIEDVDFQGLAPAAVLVGRAQRLHRAGVVHLQAACRHVGRRLDRRGRKHRAELVEGPFAAEQTENFDYQGACFQPQG